MAVKTIQRYPYQKTGLQAKQFSGFELTSIRLNTHCIAHENEIADHYKIYWIEDGSGKYQIDFKPFEIQESGLFFLSPGQVLQVETEQVRSGFQISFDKEFYCVEMHGKEIACNGVLFNNVHKATMIPLTAAESPAFQQIIQNIIAEVERPGPAHREMLETYLRMFLIQALRKLEELGQATQPTASEGNRLAGDFIALVEKHYQKIHSVSEYAEMLFVSPKSLAKRLNALDYKTPTEIIRDRIVLQAKRDLRYTNKSVKEIAFELGFEDPAYFTRLFKKSEQLSPLNYREKHFGGSN
ncbi:MAG: AraC family transcriptional regulator [Bacteroidota bacterium]